MAHTSHIARRVRAIIAATAAITACESPSAPHGDRTTADVPIRITAITVGTPISTLVVEVSAADLPGELVFNLAVVNGVASGTIKIPPGAARTIHVTAVDDQGDVTHEGSATVDVRPGQNPPVQIKLAPRSGQVPISVTFGNFSVVVTPPVAAIDMAAKAPLQLAVAVTDVNGQVLAAPQIGWATTQPAVATVSASGLVTGVINGSATIVATYEGVAGLSVITVTGGPTSEICDGLDNNLDGQIDEGLRYCLNGVPAPHSDGNVCVPGFADANGDPADGCETSLAQFNGVWSLTPALTTSCTGGGAVFLPELKHPTFDQVTTILGEAGQLSLQFNFPESPLTLPVSLDVASGSFAGAAPASGPVSGTGTITGSFTDPNSFTVTVSVTNIQLQLSVGSSTCADINQTVSATRIAN